MRFRDRADAGRTLGPLVAALDLDRPVVLGMARGGVAVASEVATELGAPLDVLVVRKLGYPPQPELAMGALGEGGVRVVNAELLAQLGVPETVVDEVATSEALELDRRLHAYRGDRPPLDVRGRSVVVVDDGLATGATARAAVSVVRARGATPVVLAVPVAPPAAVRALQADADDVVCAEVSARFLGIGEWYDDFRQVSDDEVRRLLDESGMRDDLSGEGSRAGGATRRGPVTQTAVDIDADGLVLPGVLAVPPAPKGVVVFAHGSGSSHHSPRNQQVAAALHRADLATVLFDLLGEAEGQERAKVFDVGVLGARLASAVAWTRQRAELGDLPMGLFGASTGAAAAVVTGAWLAPTVRAVVSRGGRPDLAPETDLRRLDIPVLLIVGSRDETVLEHNRWALAHLPQGHLEVVPGAGHLFEEPGALDTVALLASTFFGEHLR